MLPLLVLPLLTVAVFAQEVSSRWKNRNDRGNRWEGRIEIPVGRPTVELLSFYGLRESYDGGEDLKIRFFMPRAGDLTLQARELEERVQYFMQAKDQDWKVGEWNEFGPWPTDEILEREGVPAGNLGVLIDLTEGEEKTLLPAFVYHSSPPRAVDAYTLHVRPSAALSELSYRLLDGDEELRRDELVDVEAFEPLPLKLDAAGLPEGRLALELEGRPKGRACGAAASSPCPGVSYVFYHRPLTADR